MNLRICLNYDVALAGRTEFDLVFVALYNRSAKHDSGVATEVGV